ARRDDALTLHYQASSPQLLRVAIPYFSGWHAAVNDAELPISRVDRAFICTVLPAGEGEVRLWYAPRFFWWAASVSALALLVNLAVLAHGLRPRRVLRRAADPVRGGEGGAAPRPRRAAAHQSS